jgi:hypothetical protein
MAKARKRSVPGRVHSIEKNFGWSRGHAASNPLWTHGMVESPLKLLPGAQNVMRKAAASNQPRWFCQPLSWLAAALQNHLGGVPANSGNIRLGS